jgi:hypothetical protein
VNIETHSTRAAHASRKTYCCHCACTTLVEKVKQHRCPKPALLRSATNHKFILVCQSCRFTGVAVWDIKDISTTRNNARTCVGSTVCRNHLDTCRCIY